MKDKKQTIAQANPYMQDPKAKSDMIRRSVLSSSAVEGIYVDLPDKNNKLKNPRFVTEFVSGEE